MMSRKVWRKGRCFARLSRARGLGRSSKSVLTPQTGCAARVEQRKETARLRRRVFQDVNVVRTLALAVESTVEAVQSCQLALEPFEMRPARAVENSGKRLIWGVPFGTVYQ